HTRAAFVILQHLPAARMEAFAEWITSLGLSSSIAKYPQSLRQGAALIAPGDRHLKVLHGTCVAPDHGAPLAGHKPSATVLISSLVSCAAQPTLIVLSGMGRDGAVAVPAFVAAGGTLVVQRPDTCAVAGMPESAMAVAPRCHRLAPSEIGPFVRG